MVGIFDLFAELSYGHLEQGLNKAHCAEMQKAADNTMSLRSSLHIVEA